MCSIVVFFYEQNNEGKSPLHIAAMHGRFTGSQILIQNGTVVARGTPIIHSVHFIMYLSCLHLCT